MSIASVEKQHRTINIANGIDHTDEIQFVDTARLSDHPANPPERSKTEAVLDLVTSITEFGQREPARIRIHGYTTIGGERCAAYQVLSGHRRVAACRVLGIDVRAEIVDCDDAEALKEVVLGNADRKDLDPIQRAEIMLTMIDAGISRAEAGLLFGLNSDSGIKNTLRLLELPESMRSLVREGLLPARAARYVVPFAPATLICDRWAKAIRTSRWSSERATSDPKSFFHINMDSTHNVDARPIDGKTKYKPDWEHKPTASKFDLDEKTRKRLNVVSIPVGPKGETVEVAQNVDLFDKLNKPHLVADTRHTPGKTGKKAATAKAGSAETAAEKRARIAAANKRLKDALPRWKLRFTRCLLACHTPANHAVVHSTLPWLVSASNDRELLRTACETLNANVRGNGYHDQAASYLASMIATCDTAGGLDLADRLWRILLWPEVIAWPVGPIAKAYGPVATGDDDRSALRREPPKTLPLEKSVNDKDLQAALDMMFAFADLNYGGGWRDAARPGPEQRMMQEYFGLHTSEQLDRLAEKCKIDISFAKTKASKSSVLMNSHAKKPLPVPEILGTTSTRKVTT